MKKAIPPILIAAYFAVVLFITEYIPQKNDINYILNGFAKMPEGIMVCALLIIALLIVSVIMYMFLPESKGDKDNE